MVEKRGPTCSEGEKSGDPEKGGGGEKKYEMGLKEPERGKKGGQLFGATAW